MPNNVRGDRTPAGRTLAGRRVVVTRAAEQADDLCDALEAHGAEVLRCPTIAFAPMADMRPLLRRLDRLDEFDWIVFTSTNGVRFFADELGDRSVPAATRIAVVGSSTAEAATELLRGPDLVPDTFDAEHLLEAFGDARGRRFLLPQAEAARPTLAEGLEERGALVDAIPLYRTVAGHPPESVLTDIRTGVDALTFTSPTTARFFAELLGDDADRIARGAAIFCIGPVTASGVRELGWTVAAVADPHTVEALVDAVIPHTQPAN